MIRETVGSAALGTHPNVLATIATIGYGELSSIQTQSIPLILEGHNMIGQAQAGTGKTTALALSLLPRVDPSRREPQTLVLVPTHELALQVAIAYGTYSKQLPDVGVVAVYDGAPMGPQLKALRQGAQIPVTIPGRLCDHPCRDEKLLVTVQRLVLDEADEMLKLGFMDDLEVVFKTLPGSRQTVFFSATLPASIRGIAECHLRQPKHVKTTTKTRIVARIEQVHLMAHADQKAGSTQRLLEVEQFDTLIAFVHTKRATLDYAELPERQGYRAAVLNGDMPQAQRERVIELLEDGLLDIVIATDVAVRGLDVLRITHVLDIDMSYGLESYAHRISRTGRISREGRALLPVTPREQRMLQMIERVTGQKVDEVRLPDAETILGTHLACLATSLTLLLDSVIKRRGTVRDELRRRLGCDVETLAAALLVRLIAGKVLDLEPVRREQPLTPSAPHERVDRGEHGERPERSGECRPVALPSEGRARCRTALGTRDGVTARNLLGTIPNEGGLSREDIGRVQIHDTLSLTEPPEANLGRLLIKLKDTHVADRAPRLRRYRENRGPTRQTKTSFRRDFSIGLALAGRIISRVCPGFSFRHPGQVPLASA